MISYSKYIFGGQPNHKLFLHFSIYTCVDYERGHFIFETMDKVQFVPKGEMQQKEARKRKRETKPIGFVVQGYQIKEKKKVKVNGVEKEVTMVKSLVTSPNNIIPKDQCIANDSWGFITKQLSWNFFRSPNRTPRAFFSGPTIRIGTERSSRIRYIFNIC